MRTSGALEELRIRRNLLNQGIRDLKRLLDIRKTGRQPAAILQDLRWERKQMDRAIGALERLARYAQSKESRSLRLRPGAGPAGRANPSRSK